MAVILRAADRVAVPWKNGGGLTREVAVHPPGSDPGGFDWRVSIAEVHAAGPFSAFPGVERQMAVLDGQLSLSIRGADPLTLSADTPPISFTGDVPVFARPMGPSVTDLNVMTRRGRYSARLRRLRSGAAEALTLTADTTVLIALSQLRLRWRGVQWTLSPLDAARLDAVGREGVAEIAPHLGGAFHGVSFWVTEISASTPP